VKQTETQPISPLIGAAMQSLLAALANPKTTDILANGPADWWVDTGSGLVPSPELNTTSDVLAELAVFLVELGERHLDQASPICDVAISTKELPVLESLGINRLRVHAVLESAISSLTLISIRVHRAQVLRLADLHVGGMLNDLQLGQLRAVLSERQNFIISGASGSGKTTLLRAMMAESSALRTVVVEDTAELLPVEGHVVGLQVRQANTDGQGYISLEALAQQALRMRPDRLIVGEVRGPEIAVLLRAMNTGHLGSAATLHANQASAVFGRMRALAMEAGFTDRSFESAAALAVQKVIHLSGTGNSRRVEWVGSFQW
jgi:pilus assembly protein CpaF